MLLVIICVTVAAGVAAGGGQPAAAGTCDLYQVVGPPCGRPSDAASSLVTSPGTPAQSAPVVVTPSGTVNGVRWLSRRGRSFWAFRGLRYAEPPTGERRFQPPQPILKYDSVVDGTEEGPACPQPVTPGYYVDEDCLRLNVYTPERKSSNLLPVIVYMHPGGFYAFSGRSDVAGPHYLMDRELVLVTINYRLGSLGFLSTGDEYAPGNNGLKDQVAALQWVQRNIAAFGGDPSLVTIAGCSAGSISVALHMISPMSKGLFHRAISMSATPAGKEPTPTHQRHLAVKQAQLLNCPSNSSKEIVDCLKTKTWKELGDSLLGFFEFPFHPVGVWGAVVEPAGQPRFLDKDPVQSIRAGQFSNAVPYILSQTTDEFYWFAYTILNNETLLSRANTDWPSIAEVAFLLPKEGLAEKARRLRTAYLGEEPLRNDKKTLEAMGKMYADGIIGFNTHRMLKLMTRYSSQPVFQYEFAYVGRYSFYEDPVTKRPMGAAHHDDLLYLFSMPHRNLSHPLDTADGRLTDTMTLVWDNFARYGNPNGHGDQSLSVKWPAATVGDKSYLKVDSELSIRKNLFEERKKIWEELYPIQY